MSYTTSAKTLAVLFLCIISTISESEPLIPSSKELILESIDTTKYEYYNHYFAMDEPIGSYWAFLYTNKETNAMEFVFVLEQFDGISKIIQSTIPLRKQDQKLRKFAPIDKELRSRYDLHDMDLSLDKTSAKKAGEFQLFEMVYEKPTQRQTFLVVERDSGYDVFHQYIEELQPTTRDMATIFHGIDQQEYSQRIKIADEFLRRRFPEDLEHFQLNKEQISKNDEGRFMFIYRKDQEEQIYILQAPENEIPWIKERVINGNLETNENYLNDVLN